MSNATKRPDLALAYRRGADLGAASVERSGLVYAVEVHCRVNNSDPTVSGYDREHARGESDVLLLLASEPYEAPRRGGLYAPGDTLTLSGQRIDAATACEPRPTFAEVEAYERGFERADGARRAYGMNYAVRQHRFAAEVIDNVPEVGAMLRGQSDALLLAATARDCGDCYRGVKHMHGEARS